MQKLIFIVILFISFCLAGLSQTNRKTIIENNIKAIESVEYKQSKSSGIETKTYYTVKGEDSVQIMNDKTVFFFEPLYDENKILQLKRKNPLGIVDEIRIYKYYADSSYSIQTFEYEKDVSRINTFNSKHDCQLQVSSDLDTTYYHYNLQGRFEGLTLIKNGKKAEIVVAELDNNDHITKVNYTTEGILVGFSTYKYNERGLQEEIKQFVIVGGIEKYISKTEFKYEFYLFN